jgi:homocysteine S-methyltransferase
VLADGSEYRGDYGLSVAELRRFHRPRIEILAAAEPDVLAIETIPCLAEVEAVLAELERVHLPAWLSLTCAGDRTRAGEPLADAFTMAADVAAVVAVGVNCTDPTDVPAAMRAAVRRSGRPGVAYPNSGEGWDAADHTWTGTSAFAAGEAPGWVAAGARLVGGCCRVAPADIAALAAALPTPCRPA